MRRVDELGSNYGSGRRDDSLRARARGLKIRVYQRGDFFLRFVEFMITTVKILLRKSIR